MRHEDDNPAETDDYPHWEEDGDLAPAPEEPPESGLNDPEDFHTREVPDLRSRYGYDTDHHMDPVVCVPYSFDRSLLTFWVCAFPDTWWFILCGANRPRVDMEALRLIAPSLRAWGTPPPGEVTIQVNEADARNLMARGPWWMLASGEPYVHPSSRVVKPSQDVTVADRVGNAREGHQDAADAPSSGTQPLPPAPATPIASSSSQRETSSPSGLVDVDREMRSS